MAQTLPIAIRRATLEDAEALAGVEHAAVLANEPGWEQVTDWQKRLSEKGSFTYLAEDEQPFGYVTSGEATEEYFRNHQAGEILGLALRRDCQGRGLGKKLMVHGLSVIKRRGSEQAIIWLPEQSERAISMSLSLGFKPIEASRLSNSPPGKDPLSKSLLSKSSEGERVENCYLLKLTDYF